MIVGRIPFNLPDGARPFSSHNYLLYLILVKIAT